eukprot:325017_1
MALLLDYLTIVLIFSRVTSTFNPKQLPDLLFFIESVHGISIANCNNATCDTSGDLAPLALQFCNLEIFPFGCIRRWEDQSTYDGTTLGHPFEPPEWTHGRDFGQDDHEKPGYIPNCINGLPCARGCQNTTRFPQNCSFEIEYFNTFTLNHDLSIFHLARQVPQPLDNQLFGIRGLKHNVNNLALEIPLPDIQVTRDGAMPFNKWALIELHRDTNYTITCFINRTDVNVSPLRTTTNGISTGHYLSRYKGAAASFGDFAASIVYNRSLNQTERNLVLDYLEGIYFNPNYNKDAASIPPETTANEPNYLPPKVLTPPSVMWDYGGCDGGCDSGWVAPPLYYYSSVLNENVIVSCARSVRAMYTNGTTLFEHKASSELYYGCNYAEDVGLVTLNKVSGSPHSNKARIYNAQGELLNELSATEDVIEWRSLTLSDNINQMSPNSWYIIIGHTKSELNTFIYDESFNLIQGWPQLDAAMNNGNSWGIYADNIAILDMNRDGIDDLVVPQDVPQIAAYYFNGSAVSASSVYGTGKVWPQVPTWYDEQWNLGGKGGPCDQSQENGGYRAYFTRSAASTFQLNTTDFVETNVIVTIPRIDECDNNDYGSYTSIGHTVYVYNTDHSRFKGTVTGFGLVDWTEPPPFTTIRLTGTTSIMRPYPYPVIADLDLDGYPEILFSGWDGMVHCYPFLINDQKDEFGQFPFELNDASRAYKRHATEPLVVDIDNDQYPEIIIATYYEETNAAPNGEIIILSNEGVLLTQTSFPASTRSKRGTFAAPTAGNIDLSDANLELVVQSAGSGTIMFKLGDESRNFKLIWPTSRGNMQRTGRGIRFVYDGLLPSATVHPTVSPTNVPTVPTLNPSISPTNNPTSPSLTPSQSPTNNPSVSPTANPTTPSVFPTNIPTRSPTLYPTDLPTVTPTFPSVSPSKAPSDDPTKLPSRTPTQPTLGPSKAPTGQPSKTPTGVPTVPTSNPSPAPSMAPTVTPIPYDWPSLPINRGYISRPCGFDLNHNGIIGEEDDCNKICKGNAQSVDIDYDGINEMQYYIDCNTGTDDSTCGAPSTPCKTIDYAWNTRASAEAILCFTGICQTESAIAPGVSGNTGSYTKSASGSEQYDFEFPTNPTILCGWDKDNDNEYPPYDQDDRSIIDGSMNQLNRFMDMDSVSTSNMPSFVEMAHFEVTGFGSFTPDDSGTGFMNIGGTNTNNGIMHHWYQHDISVWNVNRDKNADVGLFGWGHNKLQYFAVINCEFLDFSKGALSTGYNIPSTLIAYNQRSHHIRMQNVLFRPYNIDSSYAATLVVMRGLFEEWEWIDNVFDGNLAPYGPNVVKTNGGLTGIVIDECCQNIIIRNNFLYNLYSPLKVWGWNGYCSHRTTSNIIIDHNIMYHDTTYWRWSLGNGVSITNDADGGAAVGVDNVTISYNIFDASDPANWQTVFEVAIGNTDAPSEGSINIYGNEAKVTSIRSTFAAFRIGKKGAAYPHQNYQIYENKVFGFTGDSFTDHMRLYECVNAQCPSNLIADDNVYSACGTFEINSVGYASREWYSTVQTLWNNQDQNTEWCHVAACNASVDVDSVVQGQDSPGCDLIGLFSYAYTEPPTIRDGDNAKVKNYIYYMINSQLPTHSPTQPTVSPTNAPSTNPTKVPTENPTLPSVTPTKSPSNDPSSTPTLFPSATPTQIPSQTPTNPSTSPTKNPSKTPSSSPSESPTAPSVNPTTTPTANPTVPTTQPSKTPTSDPTTITSPPTQSPNTLPTVKPIPFDWPSLPTQRGYISRPCGFDLNHNGIIGELSDCNTICKGDAQAVDVDGDGVYELQYYVDCKNGIDTIECGSPSSPCKSINYTWNHRASGPSAQGGEDIICFTGVCVNEELISPGVSGHPGFWIKAASGSEEYDFQFPTNPTMLCGWDLDNDNEYPPYDTDDLSIVDGSVNALTRFIDIGSNGVPAKYVEMAHFEVTGFGTFAVSSDDKGFMKVGRGTNAIITHWYHHDLSVWNVNREIEVQSGQSGSTISLWNWFGFNEMQYYAVVNCEFLDFSLYGHRGGMIPRPEPPFELQNHHIRMQNVLWRPYAGGLNNNEFTTVSKMWGIQNNWEWIDNVFDGNVPPFGPNAVESNGRLTGVLVNECCRNIIIRNNYFCNFFRPMGVTGYTPGYCDIRTTSNIIMDHNIVYHDTNYWAWSLGIGVTISDDVNKTPLNASIENVTVSFNIFNASYPANWQTLFLIHVGNQESDAIGVIQIYGNEAYATSFRSGYSAFCFGDPEDPNQIPFPQQNYRIYENKIFGFVGDTFTDKHTLFMCSDSNCPSNIVSDNNTFSACGSFENYGTKYASRHWYNTWKTNIWNDQDTNTKWCHVAACNASADVDSVVQGQDSVGCDNVTLFSYDYDDPNTIRKGYKARHKGYIIDLLAGITYEPTKTPTMEPSNTPTLRPSDIPTVPSSTPTIPPSAHPTISSLAPTDAPTLQTIDPTDLPSMVPTAARMTTDYITYEMSSTAVARSKGSKKKDDGVGIIVAVLLSIVVLVAVIYYFHKRKRSKETTVDGESNKAKKEDDAPDTPLVAKESDKSIKLHQSNNEASPFAIAVDGDGNTETGTDKLEMEKLKPDQMHSAVPSASFVDTQGDHHTQSEADFLD